MIARLRALLLLAYRLVLHLLAWPFRRAQLRLFVQRYAPDRLLPLAPSDVAALELLSGCDGCGLCDTACALLGPLRAGAEGLRPSELVLAASRSLPDLAEAPGDLELFAVCADCHQCRGWCPRAIPVDELGPWCGDLLRRLQAAGGRAAQPPGAAAGAPGVSLRTASPWHADSLSAGAPSTQGS